jgi:hypothetical protein
LDADGLFFLGIAEVCCNAARAVAGDFGFGAVRVDQANLDVGSRMRGHPLDSIGAYAIMPVADLAGDGVKISGRQGVSNTQRIDDAAGVDQ